MKIRFVVQTEVGEYPFVINTNRLPFSIGNKEIALKDFEVIEPDAPLTSKSSGQQGIGETYICPGCGGAFTKLSAAQDCCR